MFGLISVTESKRDGVDIRYVARFLKARPGEFALEMQIVMPASFRVVFEGTQTEAESPIECLYHAAVAGRGRIIHGVVSKDRIAEVFSRSHIPRISDASCAAVIDVARRNQQLRPDTKGNRRAARF